MAGSFVHHEEEWPLQVIDGLPWGLCDVAFTIEYEDDGSWDLGHVGLVTGLRTSSRVKWLPGTEPLAKVIIRRFNSIDSICERIQSRVDAQLAEDGIVLRDENDEHRLTKAEVL